MTQRGKSKASTECEHHLANGDNNMASNTWISQSEDFVYVGCFVSDGGSVDGGVTPWPDGSGNWKTLNWAQCKDAARAAGLNSFAMEERLCSARNNGQLARPPAHLLLQIPDRNERPPSRQATP